MEQRTGRTRARKGAQLSEKLLDGRHGIACNAQIYQPPYEMGSDKQVARNARTRALSRQKWEDVGQDPTQGDLKPRK